MKKHLQIDLHSLPEEGKTFSGELDSSLFSEIGPNIKPREPLYYDLFIQKFDHELLIRGNLSTSFELICDRCLNPFKQTISAEDISLCHEITENQPDLAGLLREEIIILLPDYPHCDQGDEKRECKLDSKYLAVDKPPIDGVKTPPRDEAPNPWDALDGLENQSSSEPS